MNYKKILMPLIISLTSLIGCGNKGYTVKFYDYTKDSDYKEYGLVSYLTANLKTKGVIEKPKDPYCPAFRQFAGWTTDKEHKNHYDFTSEVSSDLNLYATYANEDERVISVDYGIYGNNKTIWDIYKLDESYNEPEKLLHESHEIIGWSFNIAGTIPARFPFTITEDYTIYAIWQIKLFTVTYYFDYPTIPTKKIETVKYGKLAEDFVPWKKKEGYTFDCWCVDQELTTPFDFNTPIKQNYTLYGRYTKNP